MKLTLKQIIEWHIEDAEMSEINNEYDRGWYDCLKMVHKYVLENEISNPVVDEWFKLIFSVIPIATQGSVV